jgi:hypothetical protein
VLVTPQKSTAAGWVAELSTLRHLRQLVEAGAVLAGEPPVAPAGLKDLEHRAEFDRLVAEIWGASGSSSAPVRNVGAGRVYGKSTPLDVLWAERVAPDVRRDGRDEGIRFIHRSAPEGEIYFVFNDSAETGRVELEFRQPGRTPEIWNAESGACAEAPMFKVTPTGVAVPVDLEAWGSVFVIFRKPLPARWVTSAGPVSQEFRNGLLLTTATEVAVDYSDGHRENVRLAGCGNMEGEERCLIPPASPTSADLNLICGLTFGDKTTYCRVSRRLSPAGHWALLRQSGREDRYFSWDRPARARPRLSLPRSSMLLGRDI